MKWFQQCGDILSRAAHNGSPLWPIAELYQAMVREEPDHELRGKAEDVPGITRPDRCGHGDQVEVDEAAADVALLQKRSDGSSVFQLAAGGRIRATAVETSDVAKHFQERRT